MVARERAVDAGAARARSILARLSAEGRDARLAAGIRQSDVAAAVGISRSQLSRIERGGSPELSIDLAVRWFGVLGLDLSMRAYPDGDPLRDAAQLQLLARVRSMLHAGFAWRTEVPLPTPGDRRAWDATAINGSVRLGIEAETRIRDPQALDRRLALKERDGGMDRLVLVVADTRSNRASLRAHPDVLAARFPIPPREALDRLRRGLDPGGNALILI
jgi:transcriptional regulator with XRE-family HTH domain